MSFRNAQVVKDDVDPEEYHAAQLLDRGHPNYWMSPSHMKDFMICAKRWVKAPTEDRETPSTKWGNMIDCQLLTPQLWGKRYVRQPKSYRNSKGENKKWSPNALPCQEWKAAVLEDGMKILKPNEETEVLAAVNAMQADPVINRFLRASRTQVMVTAEWSDEATKLNIPVRCLMDLVPRVDSEFPKSIGDIKTTRNGGIIAFQRDVFKLGYHIQAAFDLDIYVAATGEDRVNWCFLIQENLPPYQTGKRILSADFLELGRVTYKKILANYCQCVAHNHWPDYDENDEATQGWTITRPEPWMESAGLFDPKYDFSEQEPGETAPKEEEGEIVP